MTQKINSAPDPIAQRLSFKDMATMCLRYWKASLVAAVAMAAAVMFATSRITPLYEARAQLEIAPSGKIMEFQNGSDQQRIDYALLNTVRDRIVSTPILERVVSGSDLAQNALYSKGNPVALLRSRIGVTISRDSWIIEVGLRDEDRDHAKNALAVLLTGYFTHMSERESSRSSAALLFLREQTKEAKVRFDAAREAESAFQTGHDITATDPDNNSHARRLQEMERVRIDLERTFAARQAVADQVGEASGLAEERRLDAQLAIQTIDQHPLVGDARRLLAAKETEAEVLSRQYGPKHPRMQQISEELTVRRAQLAGAVRGALSASAVELEEARIQLAAVNARIHEEEAALAKYRLDLMRMQALSLETVSRGKLFDELRRGLAEEEIASRLELSQVVVNSPPESASRAANTFPSLFAAAALFLGACAGIMAAFVANHLDRRIRGEDGLSALSDLPLLASVPAISGGLPVLAKVQDPDRPAEVGEAFCALRVALRLTSQYRDASADHHGCCLVVTSPDEDEGKSTVASRLAVSLAATGVRVLLVDANLRRPSLHSQFAVADGGGFSLLLAGEPQQVAHTAFANLDLLWAGQRPPHPADLLHSPSLGWYLGEARRRYAWIVIDTPPVSRFADALVIGEHADGMVLVVRDRISTRAAITTAVRRGQTLGDKLIGFVLNDSRAEAIQQPRREFAEQPLQVAARTAAAVTAAAFIQGGMS